MRAFSIASLAFASALACSTAAHANDVTFTGFANGSQTVNFSIASPNTPASGFVNAGGFATTMNGGPSFVTYCVDLYQTISFGTLYPEYGAPNTSHVFTNNRAYTDLGRLYTTAGALTTSVQQAAFQIAVWEIAYEDSANAYSLSSGAATFSGGSADASGALTLASSWLTGLVAGPGSAINVLESPLHQDVIYAPVPEPSTLALMLAGIGAGASIARRSRRRA